MNKSSFLKINVFDLIKGAGLAAITAFLTVLLTVLDSGALPTSSGLKNAAIVGAIAGLSALIRSLLINSEGKPLKKERKRKPALKIVKNTTAILLVLFLVSCGSSKKIATKVATDSSSVVVVAKSATVDSNANYKKVDSSLLEIVQDWESEKVTVTTYDSTGKKTSKVTTVKSKGKSVSKDQKAVKENLTTHVITASNFDSSAAVEVKTVAESKIREEKKKAVAFVAWFWVIILLIAFFLYYKWRTL